PTSRVSLRRDRRIGNAGISKGPQAPWTAGGSISARASTASKAPSREVLFEPGDHVAPGGEGLLLVVGGARVVVKRVPRIRVDVELVSHAPSRERLIQLVTTVVRGVVRV